MVKDTINALYCQVFYQNGKPQVEIVSEPLESIAGFINYVARTYPWLLPYLYGVYLQLNNWLPGRDPEGWKDNNASIKEMAKLLTRKDRPVCSKRIPRITRDVRALQSLTSSETPVNRVARPTHRAKTIHSFGDASGQFFGQAEYEQDTDVIRLNVGKWTKTASEKGSNFRDFATIVMKIEDLEQRQKLSRQAEIFVTILYLKACSIRATLGPNDYST